MTPEELIKKVRKIEIKTKALSHQIFAGDPSERKVPKNSTER